MANYTILLIDYEPRSIERFRQPLTEAGYTVEVATDGLSGIEAFQRLNPDMVLVEAMIPKKHGFEVCQELKRTPHGRRTPILITTGVYKGRKYRTQALHIYGCDEYIEKPIAPEQLLAVVGKFFSASAAAPAPVAEALSASPASGVAVAAGDGDARASAASHAPSEPAAPRPHPSKPPSTPSSVVKDLTEEEIMARLDAILPDLDASLPSHLEPEPAPLMTVAPPDPFAAVPAPGDPAAEHDPFLQMQSEISAELGSLSAALALDPAPVFDSGPNAIPSDQALAPSVLEALPLPELEALAPVPLAPASPETPAAPAADEPPGQVVNFDAKRSRKNKKHARKSQDREAVAPRIETPQPSLPSSDFETPKAAAVERELPKVDRAAAKREQPALEVPRGSLVESELDNAASKKGVPLWVWAAVIVVGLVAVYFTMLRDGSTRSHARPAQPDSVKTAEGGGAGNPEGAAPQNAAEGGNASLVLNSISAPPPRSQAPAAPPAPPASRTTTTEEPVEEARAATKSQTPAEMPAGHQATPSKPAITPSSRSAAIATPPADGAPKIAEPIAVPDALEGSVVGVETIAEPTVNPSTPSIAPGTLVDAADLDTAPVTLSRKLPAYSMQARQMRLQGTVVMKVLVNERGTVDEVVLVSGVPGADLNDSALRAAKAWTYRPATKSGVPVKVWRVEQVVFKM